MQTMGILGGMGPESGARFYAEVIRAFQERRGAARNHDFPEIVLHSVPSPDNVGAPVGDALLADLLRSARLLERAGCHFLAIPCNSAHIHYAALQAATQLPILNIIALTAEIVAKQGLRRPLVLGTRSTLRARLYQRALEARGITPVIPSASEQTHLTEAILSLCAGRPRSEAAELVQGILDAHPEADGAVLGCTELPLIAGRLRSAGALISSTRALSEAAYTCILQPPPHAEAPGESGRDRERKRVSQS